MHQIQLRSIPCPPPSESASRDFSCLFSRWRWTVSWSRTPVNSGSHTHNVNQCHAWTTSWKMSSICHQSRWAGGHGNLSTQLCWHMLTMLRMKEHQFKQSTHVYTTLATLDQVVFLDLWHRAMGQEDRSLSLSTFCCQASFSISFSPSACLERRLLNRKFRIEFPPMHLYRLPQRKIILPNRPDRQKWCRWIFSPTGGSGKTLPPSLVIESQVAPTSFCKLSTWWQKNQKKEEQPGHRNHTRHSRHIHALRLCQFFCQGFSEDLPNDWPRFLENTIVPKCCSGIRQMIPGNNIRRTWWRSCDMLEGFLWSRSCKGPSSRSVWWLRWCIWHVSCQYQKGITLW